MHSNEYQLIKIKGIYYIQCVDTMKVLEYMTLGKSKPFAEKYFYEWLKTKRVK